MDRLANKAETATEIRFSEGVIFKANAQTVDGQIGIKLYTSNYTRNRYHAWDNRWSLAVREDFDNLLQNFALDLLIKSEQKEMRAELFIINSNYSQNANWW
jgi:hypothetical protein